MMKQLYIILLLLLSLNYSYSQEKKLLLTKLHNKNTTHFSIVDNVPFKHNCDKLKEKQRTKCLEKSLRDQILENINESIDYEGEMYVWFTVTKRGKVIDIQTKGYPSSEDFEQKIVDAVKKLKLNKSTYKGKRVNVRCYTRVLPETL